MFHSPVAASGEKNHAGRTAAARESVRNVHPPFSDHHVSRVQNRHTQLLSRSGLSPGEVPSLQRFNRLQATIGNRGVLRSLSKRVPSIQTKLNHEHEGGYLVHEAMRTRPAGNTSTPAPSRSGGVVIQRKCACGGSCSQCKEPSPWDEEQDLQTKLIVNTIGDAFEQQADIVAERVVSRRGASLGPEAGGSPDPMAPHAASLADAVQPAVPEQMLMRATHPQAKPHPQVHWSNEIENRIVARQVGGSPLSWQAREFMEPRFQADFAQVRVHTDSEANGLAQQLHAHAFTSGQDVFFASGQFHPGTESGDRLLAHELTHVLQQRQPDSPGREVSRYVQRDATTSQFDFTALKHQGPGSAQGFGMLDADPLYYWDFYNTGETVLPVCPGCHQPDEQKNFQTNRTATPRMEVTEGNIFCWTVDQLWNAHLKDARILNQLQRRDDQALRKLWNAHQVTLVNTIRSGADQEHKTYFAGSASARERFADYILGQWSHIVDALVERSITSLVDEIDAILRSGRIPPGASLITDPETFAKVEAPTVNEGYVVRSSAISSQIGVGFEWVGKRMKVVSNPLVFEVIGHEGIYFEISRSNFEKTDPAMAHFAAQVAEGALITTKAGQFIKGFLSGLAAPVKMAAAVGANVIDASTQFQAVLVHLATGVEIPYTCIGPVCNEYVNCVDEEHKDANVCKNDAIEKAMKEATVILPLYEQGRDCVVRGDAEACGGIASMAFGMATEKLSKLSEHNFEATLAKAHHEARSMSEKEFEQAEIREAIDRPRRGDPELRKLSERPKPKEKATSNAGDLPSKFKTAPVTARALAEATELAKRNEVVNSAVSRDSRLQVSLGGEGHGVAPYGKGENAGFIMCSDSCPLVARKLDELKEILPKDSDLFHDVALYRRRLSILEKELRNGLKGSVADNAAAEIAAELRKYAGKDPLLVRILKMSPEELKANRSTLRKEASASPKVNDSLAAREARAKAADAVNAKRKQPSGVHPDQHAAIDNDPGVSKTAGKTALSTASREHPLEQDVSVNIDEIESVGGKGSIEEKRARALSLDNREFLEAPTNQKVKWINERVDLRNVFDRIGGKKIPKRAPRPRVSISMQEIRNGKVIEKTGGEYSAIWGRTFGEIEEVRTIGERILDDMKGKDKRAPGDLKSELNRRLWDEFRNPTTPEGRVVADAIERSGFGVVEVDGKLVLRALAEKELRSRGYSFVKGRGWIKINPPTD